MQPEFWNDKRPAGVPDSLDFGAYRSVVEVFERSCKKFADRPAFSNLGVTLSYAELDRLSAAFAAYLQKQTDLQPGDRIAVQMPNVLQYPIAVFGALRAGLVVVNTNPLYTAREMRHQFKDAGVRALVYLNVFGKLVEEVLPDTRIEYLIEARMGDLLPALKGWLVNSVVKSVKKMVPDYRLPQALPFRQALKQGQGHALQPVRVGLEDVAVLQYTGGTTGVSKGAMLTHGNLVANMLQVHAQLSQLGKDGLPLMKEAQEVMIAPLPLYHIYAFTANCMCMMVSGNHNVLITNPRDIPGFITLKVIDEQGNELPVGERGELCVKGPQVMKGYWQRPEATEEILDAEGWLKTGDIAVIDEDGFVRIVDRKKDLILVSGFNVYPNEIEDVVMAHPKVASCAAVGIPDEKSGEAVKLFVVARDPSLSVEELKAYCKENLTGYKIPRQIVLKDALPMTPVGKILRRELREIA